jgi:biotin synthase-related radical SAM superfamily protein
MLYLLICKLFEKAVVKVDYKAWNILGNREQQLERIRKEDVVTLVKVYVAFCHQTLRYPTKSHSHESWCGCQDVQWTFFM